MKWKTKRLYKSWTIKAIKFIFKLCVSIYNVFYIIMPSLTFFIFVFLLISENSKYYKFAILIFYLSLLGSFIYYIYEKTDLLDKLYKKN